MVRKFDYEVKAIVNADGLLDGQDSPTPELRKRIAFGDDRPQNAMMQFLDTRSLALDGEGVFVRIRALDGDDKDDKTLQLTYKLRSDVTDDDIDGAKDRANLKRFDKGYDAQIEWGLCKKVLTISAKGDGPDRKLPLKLPDKKKSRKAVLDKLPPELGRPFRVDVESALKKSDVYGPVSGIRWTGTLDADKIPDLDSDLAGIKVYVEIWRIKRSPEPEAPPLPLVEVSAKTEDRDVAKRLHDLFKKQFADFISGEQTNKTPLILKNHPPAKRRRPAAVPS